MMLASLGSAIFIVGPSLEPNTSRITEAIATGIGFLGAGTIIARGRVRGITSAATL